MLVRRGMLLYVSLLLLTQCRPISTQPTPLPATPTADVRLLVFGISGAGLCDDIIVMTSGTVYYRAPCVTQPYTGTISAETGTILADMAKRYSTVGLYVDLECTTGPMALYIGFHGKGTTIIQDKQVGELRQLGLELINEIRRDRGLEAIRLDPQ